MLSKVDEILDPPTVMLNPHRVVAAASILVNGYDTDPWESVTPPPFQSVTMYANTSGDASVDADAQCGYALRMEYVLFAVEMIVETIIFF